MIKRKGAVGLLLLALLAGGLASGIAVAASGTSTKTPTVKKAFNSTLGKTILVTGTGFTLYANSKERATRKIRCVGQCRTLWPPLLVRGTAKPTAGAGVARSRSEEHTSELQSLAYLVCRLLLEKKKKS